MDSRWERCKEYGLVKLVNHYENKYIRLHYGPNVDEYMDVRGQDMIQYNMIVENAMWQGDNLIITGRTYNGGTKTAIVNDFAVVRWF